MAYTISTHNGSKVSRQHNIRNPKVVSKQLHIRRDGVHETWVDKNPREAYKELFGEALAAYNRKQLEAGRPGRCIRSYYATVEKDAKKHAVYEMIATVGNKYNSPPVELTKKILHEFVDKWQERNPDLKLIGAYFHYDEDGAAHVHIDYIPVARGYKTGLEVQNGLVKALNAMGFETRSTRDTAQIQWERRENQTLEKICNEHGLEIEHPERDGRQHLDTEIYKAQQELQRTEKQLGSIEAKLKKVQADHDYVVEETRKMLIQGNKCVDEYNEYLKLQETQIKAYKEQIEVLREELSHKQKEYEIFGGDINDLRPSRGDEDFGRNVDDIIR